MACKVSSRGMFARLFQAEPRPAATPAICGDLVQSLDRSVGAASADQLRCCLETVATLFDAPTITAAEKDALLSGLLDADLPVKMIQALPELEFEAAKDCMRLFNQILKLGNESVVDYVRSHRQILQMLLDACGDATVSLHSNNMLRSCTQHAGLVELLFEAGFAPGLVQLAQHQNFDISSDAFCSLRQLLMTCKDVAAHYVVDRHDMFFGEYHKLLVSDDYFTKRQALGLLAEMLLDSCFEEVIHRYVSSVRFLQIQMNLLRDNSKTLRADAFRIFKLFLDGTDPATRVHQILFKNKDRLVQLMDSMSEESKESDESLAEDCAAAAQTLEALAPPSRTSSARNSPMATYQEPSFMPPTNSADSSEQVVLNDYALQFIQWHAVF